MVFDIRSTSLWLLLLDTNRNDHFILHFWIQLSSLYVVYSISVCLQEVGHYFGGHHISLFPGLVNISQALKMLNNFVQYSAFHSSWNFRGCLFFFMFFNLTTIVWVFSPPEKTNQFIDLWFVLIAMTILENCFYYSWVKVTVHVNENVCV